MSEPLLVQPTGPEGHMPPWLVDGLLEDLKAEGLDARLTYEPQGGGGAWWEVVVIWVSDSAGDAVMALVIHYAYKWLRDQFRKYPDIPRWRAAEIARYRGDEGKAYMRIEQRTADEEPVRRTFEELEDFERWTQRKPPEGVYPAFHPGDRVRVSALAESRGGQRYAGQVGTVTRYAPGGGRWTISMNDGTEIKLWTGEFTYAEAEESDD